MTENTTKNVTEEQEDELWPFARKAWILIFLMLYAGLFMAGAAALLRFVGYAFTGEFQLGFVIYALACFGAFTLIRMFYTKVLAKTIECKFLETKFMDL